MKPKKASEPVGDPHPDVTTPANSGELIIPWKRVINWPQGDVFPMGLTQTQHATHSPGVTFEQFTSSTEDGLQTTASIDQKLFLKDIIKAVKEQSGIARRTKGVWKIYGPRGATSVHVVHKGTDAMAYRNVIKNLESIGLGDHWLIEKWKATYRRKQMQSEEETTPIGIREHFINTHDVTHDDIVNFSDEDLKELHTTYPECQFQIESARKRWGPSDPVYPKNLVKDLANSQAIWYHRAPNRKEFDLLPDESFRSVPTGDRTTIGITPLDSDAMRYRTFLDSAVRSRAAVRKRTFNIRDLRVTTSSYKFSMLGQFNPNDPTSSPRPGTVVHSLTQNEFDNQPYRDETLTDYKWDKAGVDARREAISQQERQLHSQWLSTLQEHFIPKAAFYHPASKSYLELYHTKDGKKFILGPDGFLDPKRTGVAMYEIDEPNMTLKSIHDEDLNFTTSPLAFVHNYLNQAGALPTLSSPAPVKEEEGKEKEEEETSIKDYSNLCRHDLDKQTCAICNSRRRRKRKAPTQSSKGWKSITSSTVKKNIESNTLGWKSISSFQKHAPYGIPKEKGGDSPKNVERMERCVNKLMEEGHDKSSAIAICKNSLGFTKRKKNSSLPWKSVTAHTDPDWDDWDDEDWDDWDDEDWDEPKPPVSPSPSVVEPSGYNEKDDPVIAFVNASTLLSDKEVELIQKACQKQVDDHYGPFWHIGMRSIFVPKGHVAPHEAWQIIFLDKATIAGALGYHDFINGQPIAYVFISTSQQAKISPSSVASHEALEMLTDPLINTTAQIANQTFYALESCDAVQQTSYNVTVELDGVSYPVEVSNFVTPDWFRTETNGPWDFLRKLNGPLELLPNGSYIGMWTPKTGWVQKNAFGQIEPLEEDDKRYVGDEAAITIYHAPQEPQRCLRPFQRRQMDKPLQVTSSWNMIASLEDYEYHPKNPNEMEKDASWKSISKYFRDETREESRQSLDKRIDRSNIERRKTYNAEDRTENSFDVRWDPTNIDKSLDDKIELRRRIKRPLMTDLIYSDEADKHINSMQQDQWFRDAFHPIFHDLKIKIKPNTTFDNDPNKTVSGEADIRFRRLKDPTESPSYDPDKEVLRAYHPSLLRRLLDRERVQTNDNGNNTVLNLPSKAFIKIPRRLMMRSTLTHELAHILTAQLPGHGEEFRGVHLYLTKKMHGDEAFHELRKQYLYKGLRSTFKTLNADKLDEDFVSSIEDDQNKISAGQMYTTSAKNSGGNCYEVAGKYLMDNYHKDPIMRLVHGTVTSNERLGHFGHAWIEIGDTVIDNSNLPDWATAMVAIGHNFTYDKEAYYKKGGIVDPVIYDFPTMSKHILRTMHWGPWHNPNTRHALKEGSMWKNIKHAEQLDLFSDPDEIKLGDIFDFRHFTAERGYVRGNKCYGQTLGCEHGGHIADGHKMINIWGKKGTSTEGLHFYMHSGGDCQKRVTERLRGYISGERQFREDQARERSRQEQERPAE